MKRILKRGLSLVLALVMIFGVLPTTALAAVDSSGRPKDVNNSLVLSVYTGDGFPGEPAVYGTSDYKNINSSFAVRSGATFANSAKDQLDWEKINKDIVQGASSGNTSVWGVYDANGTKDYFKSGASIINHENEIKMICAVKGCSAAEAENYEIIWYVIKLQHSSGWFGATEWHIDGVIKEKAKISINYYGNGNTSGAAPLGKKDHVAGDAYTILDKNTMVKKINGVEVAFLGWSAKADGTGEEAGFYQPGDVINPTESISLYAMWDTTTQYTATVNTYLDGKLTSDNVIHGITRNLLLRTDDNHDYQLTESNTPGVYTVKITGNGKFHLYNKTEGGTYTQIGTQQLTIYNQNGSLDVHHYSVTYDANGGTFTTAPGARNYVYGESVTAVSNVPAREGYRFIGWKYGGNELIQPSGEVTSSITAPIKLIAQWEKTVDVTINVTINHEGGGGYDQMKDKDDVSLALVSRENDNSPYLEVAGKTLNLDKGTVPDDQKKTEYLGNTFSNMPGGDVDYTVVTSKSGYDTSINATQDESGDWIIDVVMTYNPSNFDVAFTVKVDESVPDRYVPDAAIVKVTFWSTDRNQWEIITQQEGGAPGVRVDIDPTTRSGSGSYPVWKYESDSDTPYGYRIQVTSFVYPDGTIVPASNVVTQDVAWTDNVYTATVSEVTGGRTYGTLKGAYIGATGQAGKLNAVITMDLHDVTFDAQGGKVNGMASQTVNEQYKIPSFKDYVPTREGGYTFAGWFEDQTCTIPATEGKDLTKDITLYAKWIAPLTISGTVSISGTYEQNDETVNVHDIDKAKEAVVVLQELRNGTAVDIDSVTVSFGNYTSSGSADYSFTGIPNEGKSYQIHVLVLNYGTDYDNESDADSSFSATEYAAVFGNDTVADVDAHLHFVPPSYDQILKVDATAIGEGFRPSGVLSEVLYRDTGDNHAFQRISQHDVDPYGVEIGLNAGIGSGKQSIWKWHTDGTLYDYQMNITKVNGEAFDSDTAPFSIVYAEAARWNSSTNAPSGDLKATLIPNQYTISFNLNLETDVDPETVTGMDAYKNSETGLYETVHTWSFDTAINAVPVREGYTFEGWKADVSDAYDGTKIDAEVHQDVVLTAQWIKRICRVTADIGPDNIGNSDTVGTIVGAGSYEYNAQVNMTATAKPGYNFVGWYEGETLVSSDAEYTFVITSDRDLTAHFAKDTFEVTAKTTTGGSATGGGSYEYGDTATVTAIPEDSYMFNGWFEGEELVSEDASYSFTVENDRTLTAKFSKYYTITTIAQTGGSVSGGGRYDPMSEATITAVAGSGYYFVGWYDEKDELITADTSYKLTVKEDRTFTAKFEAKVSYTCDYVYIFGYTDSEIGADGPLLRGELAQMIYRLVKQKTGAGNGGYSFSDTEGEWFRTGISYMASVGAIDETKSNAQPYASVTRGETYKMICLGLGFTTDANLNFSDYATILRNSGYLTDDGRVTAKIQRWEFCQLFNAILGRSNALLVDASGNPITAETYGYTDLKESDPYYEIMLRATSTYVNGVVDLDAREERNPLDEFGG